jgi:hypothetical protein
VQELLNLRYRKKSFNICVIFEAIRRSSLAHPKIDTLIIQLKKYLGLQKRPSRSVLQSQSALPDLKMRVSSFKLKKSATEHHGNKVRFLFLTYKG